MQYKALRVGGEAGFADGSGLSAALSEPGGLCRGPDESVFVADTNNQVVRIFDVGSRDLRTLQLTGVPGPRSSGVVDESQQQNIPAGASLVSVDPQKVQICIRSPNL